MIPLHKSPNKTVFKTFFDSNVTNQDNSHTKLSNQHLNKQKSTSFHTNIPTYLRTPKENQNYDKIDHQIKRSLTPKFLIKSPTAIKNELLKLKENSSEQRFKFFQSLTTRKYSLLNAKKNQVEEKKSKDQLNPKQQNIQNRIKRFQSLRSTINTTHANSFHNTGKNFFTPKNNQEQGQKLFFRNQTARNKLKTEHNYIDLKQNQNYQLFRAPQSARLNYSPSDILLNKNYVKNDIKSIKPHYNVQEYQPVKPQYFEHFINRQFQQKPKNNKLEGQPNPKAIETKRQTKIPSFINAKTFKNNQQVEIIKPKQTLKFFQSSHQKPKQSTKIVQNKSSSAKRHKKAFSVLYQFDSFGKDNSKTQQFSSTGSSFHVRNNKIFNNVFQNAHLNSQGKNSFNIIQRPKQKSQRISPQFGKNQKINSFQQNQSKDKQKSSLIQSCSIQRLNFDDTQTQENKNTPFTFLPSAFSHQKSLESFKKTMHTSKVVNESEQSSIVRLSEQNQSIEKTDKKILKNPIIEDIKQTLIACDLFSEQDYQKVIENHKNDILKPQTNTNKQSAPVHFKVDLHHFDKSTSIKNFIDTSFEQQNQQRLSSEQEKKLAQLAEMCEQKRSKWILQQTDTIKQSLKELSEFNTEKSLYDNEWKKISIKDFATSRQNRISPHYFKQIDQVREEDLTSESRQSNQVSKVSSIKVILQDDSQQKFFEYSVNRKATFKKKSQQNDSYNQLSLQDFQILLSEEEAIYINKSMTDSNTYISYTARHKYTNSIYTIKKFQKKHIKDQGQVYIMKFIQSLKLQYFLQNSQKIQRIYAIFDDRYSVYLVCQFTSTKLSQILAQGKQQKVNLPDSINKYPQSLVKNQQKKAMLFKQIIDGLQQIHLNRILHKNIHPNSVRLVLGTCKISNFTQAQIVDQTLSQLRNEYICPQVLFDSTKLAMDIWCLGILGYELLIGRKPFEQNQKTTQKVKKILQCSFHIPLEKVSLCEQFLNAALKRNPKDRASIFDLKNIWTRKLKEKNLPKNFPQSISQELKKFQFC